MAAGRSKSPAQAGLDSAPSRSKSSGAAEISDDSDTDIDIEANGGESPLLTAPFVSILCIFQCNRKGRVVQQRSHGSVVCRHAWQDSESMQNA